MAMGVFSRGYETNGNRGKEKKKCVLIGWMLKEHLHIIPGEY